MRGRSGREANTVSLSSCVTVGGNLTLSEAHILICQKKQTIPMDPQELLWALNEIIHEEGSGNKS